MKKFNIKELQKAFIQNILNDMNAIITELIENGTFWTENAKQILLKLDTIKANITNLKPLYDKLEEGNENFIENLINHKENIFNTIDLINFLNESMIQYKNLYENIKDYKIKKEYESKEIQTEIKQIENFINVNLKNLTKKKGKNKNEK